MRENTAMTTEVELDVGRFLMRLLGRLPLIVILVGIVTVGTYVWLGFVDPRYESETTLLIEAGESGLTGPVDATTGSTSDILDQQAVASQVQLLRSREIAMAIVEKLRLTDRVEFVPPAGPSLADRLVKDAADRLGLDIPVGAPPTDLPISERALDSYYERLSVYAIEGSRVITVAFSSTDRQLAADVANAVVQEYLALQSRAKRSTTSDAVVWLADQIDDLGNQVRAAEARVEAFRSANDLFATGGAQQQTLTQQQLSGLTEELTRQRSLRADAEARAAQIAAALRAGTAPNRIELIDSQLIERLVEQKIALGAESAQLSATLLPQHPSMLALDAQIRDLDRQIGEEARKVLASFETEAQLARSREQEIAGEIARLKVATTQSGDAEVELRALEREAAAQRDLLDSYLRRYREALGREQANQLPADARVISTAAPAVEPVFPRKMPMSIAAGAATFMLLFGLGLVRELASGKSLRRIEPVVALPANDDHATALADDDGSSPSIAPDFAPPGGTHMSLASLVTALETSERRNIVVTLSEGTDADGRPLAAVALARALAAHDQRAVLVDLQGDGANPDAMRDEGDRAERPGLADIVDGDATFGDAIFRDRISRAHIIGAGSRTLTPEDVSGREVETILSALSMTYDRVILDASDAMLAAIAGRFDVAVIASEHDFSDERMVKAYDRISDVSDVDILLLLIAPADVAAAEREVA